MKLRIGLLAFGITLATLVGCSLEGEDGAAGQAGSPGAGQVIALDRVGRTPSQGYAVSAAENVEYDAMRKRIYTVNAQSGAVDVFDASVPASLGAPLESVDMRQSLVDAGQAASTAEVGAANSISLHGNLLAVAVEAAPKTNTGWVLFLDATTLDRVAAVDVGALPDMVTFTADGSRVLVANEGEPDSGYANDPEGSVSVISIPGYSVATIAFTDFNAGGSRHGELPMAKMLLAGIGASVAEDLEPEYIAVSAAGDRAYVSLQENNAIAVLDLTDNSVEKIIGLGFKDHGIPGSEFDASQRDGINLKTWPVMGMYMPDTIAAFTYNGRDYVVTANEGDSREDWLNGLNDATACAAGGYYHFNNACRDELELRNIGNSDLVLGSALTGLDTDSTLGRLKISYQATRARNGSTTISKVYAYGARSFAIWDVARGERVFDSANDFERITALRYGSLFNQDHTSNSVTGDDRSDNKGPEPEALALGRIGGHLYAFIGLERMGGIMVYDISNPFAPQFVQYVNDRDATVAPNAAAVGAGTDLGPEGIRFVPASGRTGKPMLIIGNEVSGTTSVYEITATLLQQ